MTSKEAVFTGMSIFLGGAQVVYRLVEPLEVGKGGLGAPVGEANNRRHLWS